MMLASPTKYGTLPGMPGVSALPGGVPQGPWHALYRGSPGSVLPATMYPGMQMHGPVTLVGTTDNGQFNWTNAIVAAAASAGAAAVYAMARQTANPVRNPALAMGGLTLLGCFLQYRMAKAATAAAAAPSSNGG